MGEEKMNDPINFNGTWVMKSSENQDEIMKRMGYKWPVRKIANAMSMSLVMENRTDGMFVSFQTILKNSDQTLSFEKSIQLFGLTRIGVTNVLFCSSLNLVAGYSTSYKSSE